MNTNERLMRSRKKPMTRRWQLSDLAVLIGSLLLLLIYINEVAPVSEIYFSLIFKIDIFETLVSVGICIMILIYVEHRVRSEPYFSVYVQRAIDFSEVESDEVEVSTQFPYNIVGISIVTLVLFLGIDWNFSQLSNQTYGLVLDAMGAYLLGRGIFRNPTVPIDMGSLNEHTYMNDQKRRRRTAISDAFDGGWGVFFLLTGFIIQILSLLPLPTLV